jgi:ATP-dependent Clp protease adaptor protein ClpS
MSPAVRPLKWRAVPAVAGMTTVSASNATARILVIARSLAETARVCAASRELDGVRNNEGVSTQTIEAPLRTEEPGQRDVPHDDRPWIVIVWNDPVNLMSYVTLVFRQLFGYTEAKATKLMLQVHEEGKAVVSSGTREKAEYDVSRLHAKGLWATMSQD